MAFDPSQPFQVETPAAPAPTGAPAVGFDPSQPFQVETPAAPQTSFLGNAARLAAEQTAQLVGGVGHVAGAVVAPLAPETGASIHRAATDFDRADFGGEPRYTWDRVKQSPGLLSGAQNLGGYVAEQAIGSLPSMLGMLFAPVGGSAVVGVGTTGQGAAERATNQGRPGVPTLGDVAANVPGGAAEVFADRVMLGTLGSAVRPAAGTTLPGRLARGVAENAAAEGATSAVQYAGTNLGTQAGATLPEALDQTLAGAVAGGGMAAAATGAAEAGRAVARRFDPAQPFQVEAPPAPQTTAEGPPVPAAPPEPPPAPTTLAPNPVMPLPVGSALPQPPVPGPVTYRSDGSVSNIPTPNQTPPSPAPAPPSQGGTNGNMPAGALVQVAPGHALSAPAAQAFMAMSQAAKQAGLDIPITDSYRTLAQQQALAAQKGIYGQGGLAAVPGTSPHGRGDALDLRVKQGDPLHQWLQANGATYGFFTIPKEPWHWEYRGPGSRGVPNGATPQGGDTGTPVPQGPPTGIDPIAAGAIDPTTGVPTEDPMARVARVMTAAGTGVDTRFEMAPLAALLAAEGDLQPRDREGRATSAAQIAEIVSRFDPTRVIQGAEADRGAPIIGPDNIVESGNGRIAALRMIAQQHPEKWAAYRAALQAAGFDPGPEDVRSVLVRRRISEMTPEQRRQFVVEANQSATMSLSPVEQAQADARKVDDNLLGLFNGDAVHGVLSAGNQKFVQAFIRDVVPSSEHNRVVSADGSLSAEGVRRVQAALLARAFGNNDTLARSLESTDDNVRNTTNAFVDVSPTWAQMRAAVSAGGVKSEFDITEAIVRAADLIRAARDKGQTPAHLLNQQDALNPIDPITAEAVRLLASPDLRTGASREAIGERLRKYAKEAMQQTTEAGLFGGDLPSVQPADILRTARGEPPAAATGTAVSPPAKSAAGPSRGPAAPAPTAQPAAAPAPTVAPDPERAKLEAQLAKLERTLARQKAGTANAALIQAQVDRLRQKLGTPATQTATTQEPPRTSPVVAQPPVSGGGRRKAGSSPPAGSPAPGPEAPSPAKRTRAPKTQPLAAEDRLDLEDTQAETRTPVGTGEPRFRDVSRTTRASFYEQAFRDAGYDPDVAQNMPGDKQVDVLTKLVRGTYGFKDIVIDPKADRRHVIDQLLDAYRNVAFMAHTLGVPLQQIGLNGTLTLNLLPQKRMPNALGMYDGGNRTLYMPGRSNSFAHEWAHAMDHWLSEKVGQNQIDNLTSRVTRHDGLDPKQPVERAFIDLMNALFFDQAKAAKAVLDLQMKAAQGDNFAAGQLRMWEQGRLADTKLYSAYWNASGAVGNAAYFRNPAEMLARAWEAYTAARVQAAGGTNEFITKGDEAYLSDVDARLKLTFPKEAERTRIFQAMDTLVSALRVEGIFGNQAAQRPEDRDMTDLRAYDRMAPGAENVSLREGLRAERAAWGKGARAHLQTMGERIGLSGEKGNPRQRLASRLGDSVRFFTDTIRARAKAIVARAPANARPHLQWIADQIASDPGTGRFTGVTLETRAHRIMSGYTGRITNILENHGLANMTSAQETQLRDALISEDTKNTPAEIVRAAGALRRLSNAIWYDLTNAGLQVGYWSENGHLYRDFQDNAILDDPDAFLAAAEKVRALQFNKLVGENTKSGPDEADPDKFVSTFQKLLRAIAKVPRTSETIPRLDAQMAKLDPAKAVVTEIKEKLASIADILNDTKLNPVQRKAQAAPLQKEVRDLVASIYPGVRAAWAEHEADEWLLSVRTPDMTEFDTIGPEANFTRRRELPAEADKIMERFLEPNPVVSMVDYSAKAARKIAYAEKFGPKGQKLKHAIQEAARAGANPDDLARMQRFVEIVGGRARDSLPSEMRSVMNGVHTAGMISLLPRAMWTSLSEPVTTYMATRSAGATLVQFAAMTGEIVRGASWKQRAEIAQALGMVSDPLGDTVTMSRLSGSYGDSPKMDRLLTNYFRRVGLTGLTNIQTRSTIPAGHVFLRSLSAAVLRGKSEAAKSRARATLREHGVPDAEMDDFAKWVLQRDEMPDTDDLSSRQGRVWGDAIYSIGRRIIQHPEKVDRPELASHPLGRLMYGLMSYSYKFWRNVVIASGLQAQRDYALNRAAGEGRVSAGLHAYGGLAAHGVVFAGAMFLAALVSTVLREAVFNSERWDEEEKKGRLGEWLAGLAFSRTGLTGPFDPIVQAVTGLKYERDLAALAAGPGPGYFLQAAQNIISPWVGRNSANTNTAEYGQVKAVWQMLGVPAAAAFFTALPGGPLSGPAIGFGLQKLTSNEAADAVATAIVGEKDSRKK